MKSTRWCKSSNSWLLDVSLSLPFSENIKKHCPLCYIQGCAHNKFHILEWPSQQFPTVPTFSNLFDSAPEFYMKQMQFYFRMACNSIIPIGKFEVFCFLFSCRPIWIQFHWGELTRCIFPQEASTIKNWHKQKNPSKWGKKNTGTQVNRNKLHAPIDGLDLPEDR